MQQYLDAKAAYPGMLVLFRNGDFYELFEEDAELGARVLGLTLTRRDKDIPMAGFPHHALERYLGVLLRAGYRVAVCEQMEEASGKQIIRREVNRVVTPGTVTDVELLDPRQPNYLLSIAPREEVLGLAWADLSTGMFWATDIPVSRLEDELGRIRAVEVLLPEDDAKDLLQGRDSTLPQTRTLRPSWHFDTQTAETALREHFRLSTFAGFGFSDGQACLAAAGALILYVRQTLQASLAHIRQLVPYRTSEFLILDDVTRRSLELTRTLRDSQREGSLLAVIDRTVTPMGARLLQDQLLSPLTDLAAINERLDAVEEFASDHTFRLELRNLLKSSSDLARLTTRVSTGRASPRDLTAIGRTLELLPRIKAKLAGRNALLIRDLESQLELCPDLRDLLDRALVENPPVHPRDGGVIRAGYHPALDELRALATNGKNWIANYQAEEIRRTGIASLKVGYNSVFGYYLEVTHANASKVPSDYVRKQTLKNAERYITPPLKEYEEKVLTAEEKAKALEVELFNGVREAVAAQTDRLLATAELLARADFLAALGELAAERNYVRPQMSPEPVLVIRQGRHPVLDQTLPPGTFVPNDVELHPDRGQFWLITGPNMSGKSTFIRQVALITLLAHVGSFVPAQEATIGLTDRIFTRVGAADDLNRGQSTFMVEMTEAANILNNATDRSLVILDEIGRGTSTYDGVSIAWAITEFLHDVIACRALFATHYHELAQLAESLGKLRNYNVEVQESEGEVIFLHHIAPGAADRSYGLHVARLAGVPEQVLQRAGAVLARLEQNQHRLYQAPRPQSDALVDQSLSPGQAQRKIAPKAHRPRTSRSKIRNSTPIPARPPESMMTTKVNTSPTLFGDEE